MKRAEFLKRIATFTVGLVIVPLPTAKQVIANEKKDIYVLSSHIAGFQYYDGQTLDYDTLEKGARLELKLEETNRYDRNAIEVYHNGLKLGYIPRAYNTVIANLMRKNKQFYGEVSGFNEERFDWQGYKYRVFMIDNNEKLT